MKSLEISFVGAGRVGTAMGRELSRRGWRVHGYFDIDSESAHTAAKAVPCGAFETMLKLARRSDVLFFTVPDGEVARVCEELGDSGDFRARFLFHTSGILPSRVLHLAGLDRAVYSIHPFGGIVPSAENPFAGLFFGCEGDSPAEPIAREIVADIGGIFVEIDSASKTKYHLSASISANLGFALLEICRGLLENCGISQENAIAMTASIARKAIGNFEQFGFPEGMTGPIVRGDYLTIAQHIVSAEESGNLGIYLAGIEKIRQMLREKLPKS
ncbi:MAG TPA: DUF2520 domain-containing protein [candidate division Zixibacteria bacterium]|nr:DUF2520 domain-containing protein [candidate division Zixibacteria bacterium]